MIELLPRRAFFQFELPVRYLARTPRIDGASRKWTERYRVPELVTLEDETPFADVYWAWNEDYLFFAVDVPQRRGLPQCDAKQWWKGDGVRFCVDTRDARDNKRATRFCHFFYALPMPDSAGRPIIGTHRMSRAKEPPPPVDCSRIQAAMRVDRRSYSLEMAIPGACLTGWSPAEHPRIGLFYKVKDVGHGAQLLTGSDDLGWNADPSVWAVGVLQQD